MLVLALETSTELGSIALFKDGSVISRSEWRREKSHSELITSKIDQALQEAKTTAKSLDRIAVGIGPGSFTGIRIALNAAKTLSYSVGCKVFATDSFRILAEPTHLQKLPVLGLLNAHKNLIYVGGTSISPTAITVDELELKISTPHLTLGNGFDIWKDSFSEKLRENLVRDPHFSDEPSAAHLGRIASSAQENELISWKELQPLYIRASEPEEKLKAGLLKDRSRINE